MTWTMHKDREEGASIVLHHTRSSRCGPARHYFPHPSIVLRCGSVVVPSALDRDPSHPALFCHHHLVEVDKAYRHPPDPHEEAAPIDPLAVSAVVVVGQDGCMDGVVVVR